MKPIALLVNSEAMLPQVKAAIEHAGAENDIEIIMTHAYAESLRLCREFKRMADASSSPGAATPGSCWDRTSTSPSRPFPSRATISPLFWSAQRTTGEGSPWSGTPR